jgi:hypothetical protein
MKFILILKTGKINYIIKKIYAIICKHIIYITHWTRTFTHSSSVNITGITKMYAVF